MIVKSIKMPEMSEEDSDSDFSRERFLNAVNASAQQGKTLSNDNKSPGKRS